MLAIPLVSLLLARWGRDRWLGRTRPSPGRSATVVTVALCAAGVVFAVLRNLPAGGWLAP